MKGAALESARADARQPPERVLVINDAFDSGA